MSLLKIAGAFIIGLLVGHLIRLLVSAAALIIIVLVLLVGFGFISITFDFSAVIGIIRNLLKLFGFGDNILGFFLGLGIPFLIGFVIGFLMWKK